MSLTKKMAVHRWIDGRCQGISPTPPTDHLLLVEIETQTLTHWNGDACVATYRISTSKNPPSCREHSFGTPTGLHAVADKIGAGAPAGTIFKGRQPVGHLDDLNAEERQPNLITSRILRLRGLEDGHNAGPGIDSFDRYIYIHGTQHELRIGQPFSGGCVEMRNVDIIQLFDHVPIGTWVAVTEHALNS